MAVSLVGFGDCGAGQGQGQQGAADEGADGQWHAGLEGGGEAFGGDAGEKDGADQRDADGAAELLGGGEHAGGAPGLAGGDGGEHDVGERDDQQAKPGAGHDEAGDQLPGADSVGGVLGGEQQAIGPGGHDQGAGEQDVAAEPGGQRDRQPGGDGCAEAEAGGGGTGLDRRVAEPGLQPQAQHYEHALQAEEEQQLDRDPGGERGPGKQPGRQDRRDAAGGQPRPGDGQRRDQRHPRGDHDESPGGPAQRLAFQQRVDDRHQGGAQQAQAEVAGALRPGLAGLGHDQRGGDQRGRRDGDVDGEHGAPVPAEDVGADQHAAQQQAQGGGHAAGRAVHAEHRTAFLAGEDGPVGRQHLWHHDRRGGALDRAGGDQHTRVRGQGAGQAGQPEPGDPGQEQLLAAEQVTQAARGDQGDRERQQIGRDHPFQLGAAGVQV